MSLPLKRGAHAAVAFLALLFVTILPLKAVNRVWQDSLIRHAPAGKPSGRVVVVAIDDEVIGQVGPWPWDRSQTAKLFLAIGSQHPKVLSFDGYFPHRANATPGDFMLAQALRELHLTPASRSIWRRQAGGAR